MKEYIRVRRMREIEGLSLREISRPTGQALQPAPGKLLPAMQRPDRGPHDGG